MNNNLNKILLKLLNETRYKIENGTCEMTEDEAIDLIKQLSHKPLSKDQACSYLNVSRSTFDSLVKLGKLPKGKKLRGFKELRWYEDELNIN